MSAVSGQSGRRVNICKSQAEGGEMPANLCQTMPVSENFDAFIRRDAYCLFFVLASPPQFLLNYIQDSPSRFSLGFSTTINTFSTKKTTTKTTTKNNSFSAIFLGFFEILQDSLGFFEILRDSLRFFEIL